MDNAFSEEMFDVRKAGFSRFLECIVVHLDARGHVVRVNPFAAKFFGADEKAFNGRPPVGTFVPSRSLSGENQSVLFERLLAHPERNGKFDCEVQISDGSVKRVTWAVTVYYNRQGGAEEFVCIGTERQAYRDRERDLYYRFELMENFLNTSNLTAYAVDSEHRFFYMSPGILNMLGYTPEEVTGRSPDLFLESEENSRVSTMVADQILRKTQSDCIVNKSRNRNGDPVWAEVTQTFNYDQNGAFAGIFGLFRNVDKQKKAESALSDREKEFRFCIEHAQVLLSVTDKEGVIRSINSAGAQMFGKKPEEMIGRVFTEFLPDFERERVLQTFKRDFEAAVAKKNVRTVGMGGNINKISTPQGLKDILFYKTGVKVYREGRFEGILNTAVDITEVVKAREELKRHQNHLEQLVAERTAELQGLQEEMVRRERFSALGKMASVVSQEIRTPLSTISNSLFVIRERLKDKEIGVKRSIERAGRAIRRCYDIIEEFKSFTQLDPPRKKPTFVDPWLNRILDELSEVKGISIARQLDSGASIEIDPDRMHRAVLNIIENAVDAIRDAKGGEIVVRSQLAFNRLEIQILDSGIGIPRKDLEEIFEPLYSTKSFGMGLGLAISRQIIEAHGGGISIESQEKEGTKVLLWLPADSIEQTSGM